MSKTQKLKARVRAMNDRCQADPNCRVAKEMFRELLCVAELAAAKLGYSLEPITKEHLRIHYERQFYYALAIKGLTYDDAARAQLGWLAAVLGARLVHHAELRGETESKVRRIDAQLAAFDVDCPPKMTSAGTFEILLDWCN